MPVGRIYVEMHHSSLGGVGVNTWAVRFDGTFADAEGNAAETVQIVADWYDACQSLLPDSLDMTFDGLVHGLGPNDGDTLTIEGWTRNGVVAGGVLAPALCLCTSWTAPTGGRSGRGRTFLNPLATGVADANGTPTAAHMVTVRAAAAGLVTSNIESLNGAVAIWSAKDNVARDITGGSVRDQFAVLRSRRD